MPLACGQGPSLRLINDALARAQANAGNCVYRYYGDEGQVIANSPSGMTVICGSVRAMVNSNQVERTEAVVSEVVSAPTGGSAGDLRRIDIVQLSAAGVWSIKAGDEGATPAAPTVDAGNLLMADLYLRNGMTSIEDADDSTNGYIVDRRVYG